MRILVFLQTGTQNLKNGCERSKEKNRSAIRQLSERGVIVSKKALPRKPLTKKRLKNLILNVVTNPFNMVVLVSLVILFCLIIIPLLTMISTTFTAAQAEVMRRRIEGAQVGDFTLYYWTYMLASSMSKSVLWEPLRNSLLIGACVVVISVPLILLFLAFRKKIMEGVSQGGTKG